jgi:hypothetical protein
MYVEQETLISSFDPTATVLSVLKFTAMPEKFFPFPFNWTPKTGPNVTPGEMEFCFVPEKLRQTPVDHVKPYISLLMGLFQDRDNMYVDDRLNSRFRKYTQSHELLLDLDRRWEGVNISAENGTETISIPMKKMPILIKIMLYYVQIGIECIPSPSVATSQTKHKRSEYSDVLIMNLALDLKNYYFKIINNTKDRPFFVHQPKVTYSSPAVLVAVTQNANLFTNLFPMNGDNLVHRIC